MMEEQRLEAEVKQSNRRIKKMAGEEEASRQAGKQALSDAVYWMEGRRRAATQDADRVAAGVTTKERCWRG